MAVGGTQPFGKIAVAFEAIGGEFGCAPRELASRAGRCRALLFDWDGVFNSGSKGNGQASRFDEPDSMGTNMLRYGLWRMHGSLPFAAIISGANNENALEFAEREHFSEVYLGIRDKRAIVEHLCERDGLKPDEIACVWDDINDLSVAAVCGVRFQVRRDSSPLFVDYVARNGLRDYLTASTGGAHAVREVCELMLGLTGQFDAVVASRAASDADYASYFAARQQVRTGRYADVGGSIVSHPG
ncbi:MAG: phosphatase [Gammaproteobacteria bacterium]|nr:phosphatase [Gammaproteobacteria bacterium]MDH4254634.1 phosphatase [Gammaproteobacteria bacterium]MDH5309462.1 phosphatase [Gammaproteobacteria bacterium]